MHQLPAKLLLRVLLKNRKPQVLRNVYNDYHTGTGGGERGTIKKPQTRVTYGCTAAGQSQYLWAWPAASAEHLPCFWRTAPMWPHIWLAVLYKCWICTFLLQITVTTLLTEKNHRLFPTKLRVICWTNAHLLIQNLRQYHVWKKMNYISNEVQVSYFVELPQSNFHDYTNSLTFPWLWAFFLTLANSLTFPGFQKFQESGNHAWYTRRKGAGRQQVSRFCYSHKGRVLISLSQSFEPEAGHPATFPAAEHSYLLVSMKLYCLVTLTDAHVREWLAEGLDLQPVSSLSQVPPKPTTT